MKEKIEQIIDRNTEGNYLLSSTDKAQMVSEILDLVGVTDSLGFDKGYEQGYNDATREACQEIAKNYQPNDR